jgi:hypothetical protein
MKILLKLVQLVTCEKPVVLYLIGISNVSNEIELLELAEDLYLERSNSLEKYSLIARIGIWHRGICKFLSAKAILSN